jgi:hypothetical protein
MYSYLAGQDLAVLPDMQALAPLGCTLGESYSAIAIILGLQVVRIPCCGGAQHCIP